LLYLERVVEPHVADYSTEPRRVGLVLTALVANMLMILVGWLIFSGVREHAAGSN
jgi:capsular polysaccharide transport system permease protein